MGINVIQVVHGIQSRKHVPLPVPKTTRSHLTQFKCSTLESKAQTHGQVAVHQEPFTLLCWGPQQQCRVLMATACQWAVRTHLETHHKVVPSGTVGHVPARGSRQDTDDAQATAPVEPLRCRLPLTAPTWLEKQWIYGPKACLKVCLFQTSYQCREQMGRRER